MKKLAVFVLAAVLCLSMATACFADEIVIGGINDLTGNRSVTGNAINNGAILAFEEINAAGGINGDMIKFVSYDNKNDTQETINAYTRLAGEARASDLPSATDNGAAMLAELSDTNTLNSATKYFNETYGFEPLAKLVGANGRSLWANWLLGLDPSDADVHDISLAIDIASGVPRISWDPDLPRRTYTLYGCDSLSSSAPWYIVPTNELDTTSARFFRLSVDQ